LETLNTFDVIRRYDPDGMSFKEICETLDVDLKKPGWPDRFGAAIRSLFEAQKGKKIKALSLFSGAGGLDIGFHDCGFDILEMVEFEDRFVETLRENTGKSKYLGGAKPTCIDIRKYYPDPKLKVDFIIGGPPCQTFSAAGRRASGVLGTTDERGVLFKEYVRLLKTLKPKGFLFENVYGITGAQNGEAWKEIQEAFQDAGYYINFMVLDAADYGVPQHRERLFIVGSKANKKFNFPRPTHGPDSDGEAPYYTAGDAVRDQRKMKNEIGLGGRYGHLLVDIPPGLNYSFYTEKMGHPRPQFAWRSKFSDFLYKADPKSPARTIKAQGGKYTGPFHWENRPFEQFELKRLQTFPDIYQIEGSNSIVVKQIGNSVPPQLARMLALSIQQQVFKTQLPFNIATLEEEEKLGFRSRKRALSEKYSSKAGTAIEKNGITTSLTLEKQKQEGKIILDEKFNLTLTEKSKNGFNYIFDNCKDAYVWNIHVFENEKKNNSKIFKVTIKSKFDIKPNNKLELRIIFTSLDNYQITCAFKLIEAKLKEFNVREDLVQFLGYYQYELQSDVVVDFGTNKSGFSKILASILNGEVTRKTALYSYFAEKWNCSEEEVIKSAFILRDLGFEVRNKGTNPQMPDKHLLIPYEAPTLNSRSVQLNKKLQWN